MEDKSIIPEQYKELWESKFRGKFTLKQVKQIGKQLITYLTSGLTEQEANKKANSEKCRSYEVYHTREEDFIVYLKQHYNYKG